jgi:hypothetical protein
MGAGERKAVAASLKSIPDDAPRVLLATGRYIGGGFDDTRLGTLFLALPISWRGTIQQYAGRRHRLHGGLACAVQKVGQEVCGRRGASGRPVRIPNGASSLARDDPSRPIPNPLSSPVCVLREFETPHPLHACLEADSLSPRRGRRAAQLFCPYCGFERF